MANQKNDQEDHKIHASPTKDFFVNMITKDIALDDCILDLLDNSIDGALRSPGTAKGRLSDFVVGITFDETSFAIRDNCGGITLSDAIDFAFHFGRRKDAQKSIDGGIGLYGIGMKRAIFKIGRSSTVLSETDVDSFSVRVDVERWLAAEDWDFDYQDVEPKGSIGTSVMISTLRSDVIEAFRDPVFKTSLIKKVARDYAFWIAQGLTITISGTKVSAQKFPFKISDFIQPAVVEYNDSEVHVRIVAGLADEISDDSGDDPAPSEKVEKSGWFVVCNNRIVLAADKTDRTIWGLEDYRVWHPQYNGFSGFVFFSSDDPSALPWTTTKRDIEPQNPLFQRALPRMRHITDQFVRYTNQRKADLEAAKVEERRGVIHQEVLQIIEQPAQPMKLPLEIKVARVPGVTISYWKPLSEVDELRESFGNMTMAAREVGSRTFEYYQKVELGK